MYVNKINGYILNACAECTTDASTAAKTVTIPDFELITNAVIFIKFTYANTAALPTLSINNGTAIPIYSNNDNISSWEAGEIVQMLYNDGQWNIIGEDKIEVVML
jgi:hypothetical protein